jgi:hypothetical protein
MVTMNEFRYSPELGINLYSVVDNPQMGHQTFTATDVSTNEPDPDLFKPPHGYQVVDHRKSAGPVN